MERKVYYYVYNNSCFPKVAFLITGSITLKVPKALRAKLQLSGSVVKISPELQMQEISSSTEQGHQTVQGKI